MYYPDPYTSFIRIHEINKRALPADLLIYKHATQLHKLYNSQAISNEWLHLNANKILTSRQATFITYKTNKNKIGLNSLANRLYIRLKYGYSSQANIEYFFLKVGGI